LNEFPHYVRDKFFAKIRKITQIIEKISIILTKKCIFALLCQKKAVSLLIQKKVVPLQTNKYQP